MKIYFTGVLLLCCLSQLACQSSNPKTSSPTPAKQTQETTFPKQKNLFSPGSVGIVFQIKTIENQGPSIHITAKVLSVLGYGAGVTQVFTSGDQIDFTIAKEQKVNITFDTPMKAIFSLQEKMGTNKAQLQYQKSIKQ